MWLPRFHQFNNIIERIDRRQSFRSLANTNKKPCCVVGVNIHNNLVIVVIQIKFWTNRLDTAAQVELISSWHDKGISWATLFITEVFIRLYERVKLYFYHQLKLKNELTKREKLYNRFKYYLLLSSDPKANGLTI